MEKKSKVWPLVKKYGLRVAAWLFLFAFKKARTWLIKKGDPVTAEIIEDFEKRKVGK